MKDHLSVLDDSLTKSELKHYGVKGMKWGVRRSKEQLSSGDKPSSSASPDAQRYAKLQTAIKSGKGADLSNDDLNFYNNRTDALRRLAKVEEKNPGWLRNTLEKNSQKQANKILSDVSGAVAKKYITNEILKAAKIK